MAEVIIGREHCQVMTDAQAGQQRVDGSNLNPAAAAPVAEFGRLDVIATVWDQ